MTDYFLGIDVGTGSARAGIFDAQGNLVASAKHPIRMWQEEGDFVEQSSSDIWAAVVRSVRNAVSLSKLDAAVIKGIGFDATCSLVAVRQNGSPVSVSRSGDPDRNVIVWMDHRAIAETDFINSGHHAVLRYVGGKISPEMETPKLLWLKTHLPEQYAAADYFFDLSDFLSWRATGSLARSICTVTCKWTYLAHEGRWDDAYFHAIGLGDLVDDGFKRIGTEIVAPGTPLGSGLSAEAALELGLAAGTPVGAGLIDAHAGGVGTLGASESGALTDQALVKRLAYIFGTSACSMASTKEPTFVDGVWGPYYSAMIPGFWLNEGGQSAAGAAMDHLVTMHPLSAEVEKKAKAQGLSLVAYLDHRVSASQANHSEAVRLADGVGVVPEFLGNRSPLADPDARAIIAGLTLDRSETSLITLYVAGVVGLGYGLRQLLEAFADKAIGIDLIVASGGAASSPLVLQLLADATQTPVASASSSEPVLLGAAMLGAVAAGTPPTIAGAMASMSKIGKVYQPAQGDIKAIHSARYEGFLFLQQAARRFRDL
jgi:D-ribulokinase